MRSLGGTETRASRLMAVMVGRIMIASTITAGRHAGAAQVGGEQRIQPSFRCSQWQAGRISGMTTNNPHRP